MRPLLLSLPLPGQKATEKLEPKTLKAALKDGRLRYRNSWRIDDGRHRSEPEVRISVAEVPAPTLEAAAVKRQRAGQQAGAAKGGATTGRSRPKDSLSRSVAVKATDRHARETTAQLGRLAGTSGRSP